MKNRTPKSENEITSLSAIEHVVEHRPDRILHLSLYTSAPSARVAAICEKATRAGVKITPVRTTSKEPTGPLSALLAPYVYADWRALIERYATATSAFVLALDHLQDPQNFGAICRSAEAFGVDAILTPQARSAAVTAAVYNASVGAVETIAIANPPNLGEALRRLKKDNFWVIGSALGEKSVPLPQAPHFDKTVLVLGAEGEGLSPLIRDLCDVLVEIPMPGKIESLNVSAAGAVLLYALRGSKPRT